MELRCSLMGKDPRLMVGGDAVQAYALAFETIWSLLHEGFFRPVDEEGAPVHLPRYRAWRLGAKLGPQND